MQRLILLTLLLGMGCDDEPVVTECAKVLCADDEYCRSVTGGARPQDSGGGSESLPECTVAPEACGGTPSCDCLTDCTSCSDEDGVYCSIEAP
jgi:hypothetical protein